MFAVSCFEFVGVKDLLFTLEKGSIWCISTIFVNI